MNGRNASMYTPDEKVGWRPGWAIGLALLSLVLPIVAVFPSRISTAPLMNPTSREDRLGQRSAGEHHAEPGRRRRSRSAAARCAVRAQTVRRAYAGPWRAPCGRSLR